MSTPCPRLNKSLLHVFTILSCVIIHAGCSRVAPSGPTNAFREIEAPNLNDAKAYEGLDIALMRNIKALESFPKDKAMHFGPLSITHCDYIEALKKLHAKIRTADSPSSIDDYIREHFRFFEIFGGDRWGEVLATGYFEPVLRGSTFKTKEMSQPLYQKPDDLLTIKLGQFSTAYSDTQALKGRVSQNSVTPFYTRQDIDGQSVLANRSLELAWVDPIDAFFLHIQGSGTIQFPNGEKVHLVYADKNGHRYEPIGKFLKQVLPQGSITMQSIRQHLSSLSPTERDAILYKNPSYVFFARSTKRSITALGIPATQGRTIAADRRFAPKGALALLNYKHPLFDAPESDRYAEPTSYTENAQFVFDQDSGGAITGPAHIDLFCGSGPSAERDAGVMRHKAHLVYLAPK